MSIETISTMTCSGESVDVRVNETQRNEGFLIEEFTQEVETHASSKGPLLLVSHLTLDLQ